ncbi:TonB-dependent receptor [Caulobacter sp. S45]|jgi:iron complex outermembrane receptor protein|uniref:TonB-dependent receptor n=1 Tax=Caulobacter sp. S45 TaxID=1641861 RepID=UPI00131CD2E3|nr:TonB-dependent receptor [Caulobacter sp. S45]
MSRRSRHLTGRASTAGSLFALAAAGVLAGAANTARAADAAAPVATAAPDTGPTTYAKDAPELETVVVTASRGTAAALAPATAPLTTREPASVINRTFIEDSVPDTGDYNEIVMFAPGVTAAPSSNGPGLGESEPTLRGFTDGEYNVTFDAIPFADTNDPTHHSTAYFPASTLGAVQIDRGPGDAGNLGQATYGGSINLFSRTLTDDAYLQQKATYGSWDTSNFVTTLQSGKISQLHDTRIAAGFQELDSSGALSFNHVHEYNQFLKIETPIDSHLTFSAFATHNSGTDNEPDNPGVTMAQEQKYGKNFSLTNNPASPTYYGYNTVSKETDLEYMRLKGNYDPGFSFEDSVYTYAYRNDTLSATDTTQDAAEVAAGTFPTDAVGSKAAPKGNLDVLGYDKLNEYRVFGNILRLKEDLGMVDVRAGLWYETAVTNRHRFDLDRTLDNAPNPIEKAPAIGPAPPANIQFQERSKWIHYEPFVDVDIKPFPGLTITPGVKYFNLDRKVDSPVNSKTRVEDTVSAETFQRTLAFASANYLIAHNWSAYAQYAQGFLAPPLSIFYVLAPGATELKPQTSTNYQVGSVYNTNKFTFDADYYYIELKNAIVKVTGSDSNPVEANDPGTSIYKGIEGEATYALYPGLAVFANGSTNSAEDSTHKQVAEAPTWVAAIGGIYKYNKVSVALLNKFIGPQWAIAGEPSNYKINPYNTSNLILGYDFGRIKAQIGIYDLFDNTNVTAITQNDGTAVFGGPAPSPLNNHDQYFFQPGRSVQFTLRATL